MRWLSGGVNDSAQKVLRLLTAHRVTDKTDRQTDRQKSDLNSDVTDVVRMLTLSHLYS